MSVNHGKVDLTTLTYMEARRLAKSLPRQYWTELAYDDLFWHRKFTNILNKNKTKWYIGGKLNMCYNCLDTKIEKGFGNQIALYYDSSVNKEKASFTYNAVLSQVCRLANILKNKCGIKKGNHIFIYMPNIPEAVFSILACSRIGAPFCVVPDTVSVASLRIKIQKFKPHLIVTANLGYKLDGSKIQMLDTMQKAIKYLQNYQEVAKLAKSLRHLIYTRPNTIEQNFENKKFLNYNELMKIASDHCEVEPVDSNHPLFVIYTSGTTGDPKGLVLDTAGTMVMGRFYIKYGMGAKIGDVFLPHGDFSSALIQGFYTFLPFLNCCTTVLYEGNYYQSINHIVETERLINEYRVNYICSAPSYVRVIKRNFDESVGKSFPTTKKWLTGGEVFDSNLQPWVKKVFGCDLLNSYGQTQMGTVTACPCRGFRFDFGDKEVPGNFLRVIPGLNSFLMLTKSERIKFASTGDLVFSLPLVPGVAQKILGDKKGFRKEYLTKFPGYFDTQDVATFRFDGHMNIESRQNDSITILGINYNTIQMEKSCSCHPAISEMVVVKRDDPDFGSIPFIFATLYHKSDYGQNTDSEILEELFEIMKINCGNQSLNFQGVIVSDLPRSKSGKLHRRVLADMLKAKIFQIPNEVYNPETAIEIHRQLFSMEYTKSILLKMSENI